MGMTRQGLVVFYTTSIEILADEKSFKSGRLLLRDFKTDGGVGRRLRMPPWDLQHAWNQSDYICQALGSEAWKLLPAYPKCGE